MTLVQEHLIVLVNLFMQSTNSHHALSASNRKFYWNSIENYFEPINYDSNANINNDISIGILRYPFSKNLFTAFDKLEIIDILKFL